MRWHEYCLIGLRRPPNEYGLLDEPQDNGPIGYDFDMPALAASPWSLFNPANGWRVIRVNERLIIASRDKYQWIYVPDEDEER